MAKVKGCIVEAWQKVSIRLPGDIVAKLRERAKKSGRPLADEIRDILVEGGAKIGDKGKPGPKPAADKTKVVKKRAK